MQNLTFYGNNFIMHRARLFFLFIFALPSFFSCNKVGKINTLYARLNDSDRIVTNIDRHQLEDMMDKKQTFALIQTANCTCSDTFIEIANRYIKRDGLIVYSISYDEIKKTSYDFSLRPSSPTFHLVQRGNNLAHLEQIYTSNNDFFFNYETFSTYMDLHVAKPSIYFVSESELDNLYSKNDKFAIYFAKMDCSECTYLNDVILNQYAQEHMMMKKMYIFDFTTIAKDQERFNALRNKYGLSYASNNAWGYESGALPLIQYIDPSLNHSYNNSIQQAFTFGNDMLSKDYKVTKSYFDSARVKNIVYTNIASQIDKQYSANEVIDNISYITLNNATNERIYKNASIDFFNYLNSKLN